ncbi:hypothetical protein [Bosea sp. FBZP-16]|uniref:hypothetical protein n=1 Tax=Bosea sp. FBZP-16 TaxID=2065382 RepID=UPI000C3146DF|nr:hypothetical protein [Bosea sp. FBZP-16]
MDTNKVAAAFNEWMRRYTEDPAAFDAEFQTVGRFLAEQAEGKEPSYGDRCVAMLEQLMAESA